jgi:sporulation protein YabP
MQEEKRGNNRPHNLIMENRKTLTVSGVDHVDSFDEQTVVMATVMGELTVKGNDLHIDKLNTDVGEVAISGSVYGLIYTDEREKGGFLSRLFR